MTDDRAAPSSVAWLPWPLTVRGLTVFEDFAIALDGGEIGVASGVA